MNVHRKAFPVELKALDDTKGTVEALVSVFGNVDRGGDRVMPGAFAASIGRWKADGRPVPVVFSHKWDDPWAHIGAVDALEETPQGLKATYTLDIDDNPLAAHIYRLMKRGSLKEHSFAYQIGKEKTGEDGAKELHELDLIEVGPTLKGMNPDTELLAVKALEAEVKAGRVLSKANESALRDARDAIDQVLSSLGGEESEKSAGSAENEKADEADDVKAEAEGAPASDTELLSLQRQINALRS